MKNRACGFDLDAYDDRCLGAAGRRTKETICHQEDDIGAWAVGFGGSGGAIQNITLQM